jgi:phosphoenolpyruvate carboxykinase (GTP)
VEGRGKATESPIGWVPTRDALTLDGLNISRETMDELLRVDASDWARENEETAAFFKKFGSRFPNELHQEHGQLVHRLGVAASAD